jgi:hypothetical protein
LLKRVEAGDLSPHRAVVEAGFRKVPTPLEVLKLAWVKANTQERQDFREWIDTQ